MPKTTITTSSTTTRLWGYDKEINDSVRALLFGVLLKEAWAVLEHYRSDLYHDANWIKKEIEGPCTFYWSCDGWGTYIGLDRTLVVLGGREHVFEIELQCHDNGEWWTVVKHIQGQES